MTNTYTFFDVIFSDGSILGFASIIDVYTYAALAGLTVVAISNNNTFSLTVTEID